jgi:hypothetical protein
LSYLRASSADFITIIAGSDYQYRQGVVDLNKSIMNIPSECRTGGIGPNHAMILPHDANS